MRTGTFYAVSVGPGDPMDMTLRAKQVLEQADVLVIPVKQAGEPSAAYGIARQGADLSRAALCEIVFPMKAHADYRTYLRGGALLPVEQALEAGKQVAMVTLGDVSVYSTATYVRQILAEKGYATQVIAGIPSFCAGAARAQYSLCENGESLLVLPGITAQAEIEAALAQFENVVIMKAGRTLSGLLPLLQEQGLLEKTVMFRDVGMETAYVGEPKADGNSYFTTLLIKKGGLR